MQLLAILDDGPHDEDVLRAARRLSDPGERVVLCSILPHRAVRETRSSRLPGSHGGPRVSHEPASIPTATGQLLSTQRLRAEPAESRAAAAERLVREREIHLRSLAARALRDRESVVEVDVARIPAGHVLRLARVHGVDAVVTGVEATSWRERLRNGDRVRALIAAAEVPVFVVPAGVWSVTRSEVDAEAPAPAVRGTATAGLATLVAGTPAPAFALDDAFRVCALNDAAVSAFAIVRDRVMGRPCYEVLRPADPEAEVICGEGCPQLARLRAGESVSFGRHAWRDAEDSAPFAATSITVPRSLQERDGAIALLVAEDRS